MKKGCCRCCRRRANCSLPSTCVLIYIHRCVFVSFLFCCDILFYHILFHAASNFLLHPMMISTWRLSESTMRIMGMRGPSSRVIGKRRRVNLSPFFHFFRSGHLDGPLLVNNVFLMLLWCLLFTSMSAEACSWARGSSYARSLFACVFCVTFWGCHVFGVFGQLRFRRSDLGGTSSLFYQNVCLLCVIERPKPIIALDFTPI